MKTTEWIEQSENRLLHTYNRAPLVLHDGEGMYLYDTEKNRYLDFAAGIGVCALGYGHKRLTEALKEQVTLLTHTSNLYYNLPAAEAAEKVCRVSGMDRVFFTNSGTEAIEGAIKAARKYHYTKTGKTGGEIIAMEHSFHGRSLGALSVTGKEAYRKPFEPLIEGVHFATYNDFSSVEALVNENTCAVILETVQGEGGIFPAEQQFLSNLRTLSDSKDILLILDEVQCGMGRTGSYFAFQQYAGVRPDIMTVAKALGSGVPVGAFLLTEEVAKNSLVPGDHGTTYGGNPFVCRAVSEVLDIFEEEDIISHVNTVAPYMWKKLENIKNKFDFIIDHRGKGLMQGLQFSSSPAEVVNRAREQGLILITAEQNTLRFLPPLILEQEHVDEMADKLCRALQDL